MTGGTHQPEVEGGGWEAPRADDREHPRAPLQVHEPGGDRGQEDVPGAGAGGGGGGGDQEGEGQQEDGLQ